ncbi:MAG: hypothetical protein A2Z20_11425 [Bdellovibrionales bacterium RBG_16_40_8]|nr:MAG: hypothetical protein A2Z20_11425 [Bdellovibrionales bacterium RBG_16_40_8]
MAKIIFIFSGLVLTLIGCASGHCRGRKAGSEKHIFIYKADGSKQCEKKKNATSVDVMAEELKDIMIYSKENKSDGFMHIAVCGSATGKINIFEIKENDLEKAKALGFQEMKNDN